jgi:Aconitase C-terminal domain
MMAQVVMENYDLHFAEFKRPGDVVVRGLNFGTGSSLEQAVTALAAQSLPLVIAGSFSQTYLSNAFYNGFLCVEVPELVERLRQLFADRTNTERTIIPGDKIHVDLTTGTITYRGVPLTAAGHGAAIAGDCRGYGEPCVETVGVELRSRRADRILALGGPSGFRTRLERPDSLSGSAMPGSISRPRRIFTDPGSEQPTLDLQF